VYVWTEATLFFKGPCFLLWLLNADKETYSLIELMPVITNQTFWPKIFICETSNVKHRIAVSWLQILFSHCNLERKATCKLVAENNVWSEGNGSDTFILPFYVHVFYIKATASNTNVTIPHKSLSLASRPMDSQHAPPLTVKLSYFIKLVILVLYISGINSSL
jgi:hypothetical protein